MLVHTWLDSNTLPPADQQTSRACTKQLS